MTRANIRRTPIIFAALTALVLVAFALTPLFYVAEAQDGHVPAKPTGLAADVSHNQVVLTWDDPDDDTITGHVILRRNRNTDAEGQFTELVRNTGIVANTYIDNSVVADTPYTYRIKAINQHGVSERSRWFHIDTPAVPDPGDLAPSNLTAIMANRVVVLNWDTPADDNGSITGYEILRAVGDGEPNSLVEDTGNAATTYTDATAARASTIYTYRVRTIREGEQSQESNEAWVQLPPQAPQRMDSTATHDSVTLTWDDPQDHTITGYRIMRRDPAADDPGQFSVLTEDTGAAETSYTDTDVTPEQNYVYRAQARSTQGLSDWSPEIQANTLPAPATQTPEATVSEPSNRDLPTSTATKGYIAIGESATGSIKWRSDRDAFRVRLESGVTYQIDLKGDATSDGTLTDPYLSGINDDNWELIPGTSNDNSNKTLNSRVLFTPTEHGSYYIVVRSAVEDNGPYSTGTYTVAIKVEGEADEEHTDLIAADPSTIVFLGVGGEVEATIDYFADEDWFKAVLSSGSTYAITVTSSLVDNSLTLEIPWLLGLFDSESQRLLMGNRDGLGTERTQFEGTDGIVVAYHTAENDGTYYVSVSSGFDVGTYRVSVKEVPAFAYHGPGDNPDKGYLHFHELGNMSPWRNFYAWCPQDMEQGTIDDTPVAGGTHVVKWLIHREVGVMPNGAYVPIDTLAECVGVGDPYIHNGVPLLNENGSTLYSNNRRWYLLLEHNSPSNDVPGMGTLSNANPVLTRIDYLRYSEEQDWSRFSVSQAGTFCVSVDAPAVTVNWNNGGDAQSIPEAVRVYWDRVSKHWMSLDFANDPDDAKATWLTNSDLVRVEWSPPEPSNSRVFYSDGTELRLEDTWHLYDGTVDGDNYGGFVGDKRSVVSYARQINSVTMDRKLQYQKYMQVDGKAPREYFARVVHGGTGYSGQGGYTVTTSLGKCLPHPAMRIANDLSDPPPPKSQQAEQQNDTVMEDRPHGLSAVAENDQVNLTWNAPDDANAVINYRILRHRPEKGEPEPLVYVDYTGSQATAYTDTKVQPGVLHMYQVQATDLFGYAGEASEPTSIRMPESNVNLPATGAPTISGTAQVGETLTVDTSGIADEDGLDNAAFAYQWLADDADTSGATGSTYTLTDGDEGKTIKVQVSFTDDAGNEEELTSGATDRVAAAPTPNTPATGAPTISGTAQVGETLTADTSGIADEDGLSNAAFNYQWISNDGTTDTDITDATDSTHTLAADDKGKTIKVKVSFTDDADNEETLTSAATATVDAAPNNPATGAPSISGTAQVGETLTADTSGIADADGLSGATFSFQWVADDAAIAGATGNTYTLTDSDEGKAIRVRVSFTDDAGYGETLTSPATGIVAAALLPLTVSLENTPATHDGTDVFTFEIRFSEEFDLSFRTLKFDAFTVTGGTVTKAQRMDKPSNILWRITVQPDSNGDVTIVLPVTNDCDDQGAICTGDGRKLSNGLEFTVVGPGG